MKSFVHHNHNRIWHFWCRVFHVFMKFLVHPLYSFRVLCMIPWFSPSANSATSDKQNTLKNWEDWCRRTPKISILKTTGFTGADFLRSTKRRCYYLWRAVSRWYTVSPKLLQKIFQRKTNLEFRFIPRENNETLHCFCWQKMASTNQWEIETLPAGRRSTLAEPGMWNWQDRMCHKRQQIVKINTSDVGRLISAVHVQTFLTSTFLLSLNTMAQQLGKFMRSKSGSSGAYSRTQPRAKTGFPRSDIFQMHTQGADYFWDAFWEDVGKCLPTVSPKSARSNPKLG